jgi:hypothetical protein
MHYALMSAHPTGLFLAYRRIVSASCSAHFLRVAEVYKIFATVEKMTLEMSPGPWHMVKRSILGRGRVAVPGT